MTCGKQARKHLKRIEDVVEHLSTKLGVEVQPEKPSIQNEEKVYIAAAHDHFASIAELDLIAGKIHCFSSMQVMISNNNSQTNK